jgi:hypothetical protein
MAALRVRLRRARTEGRQTARPREQRCMANESVPTATSTVIADEGGCPRRLTTRKRPRNGIDVSIKEGHPAICEWLPRIERTVYSMGVPRTDENGRQLKALLSYLLDGNVHAKKIYDALGISSTTYYRRVRQADYPNAEELRLVARSFDISYPDLVVRFGLMTPREVKDLGSHLGRLGTGRRPSA